MINLKPEERPDFNATLKTIVLDYLKGDIPDAIAMRLAMLAKDHRTNGKKLFTAVRPLRDEHSLLDESDPIIHAILKSLGMQRPLNEFTDCPYNTVLQNSHTLYDLLKALYYDKSLYKDDAGLFDKQRFKASRHHIGHLLTLINRTHQPRSWASLFMFGALLSAGLGTLFYYVKEYLDEIVDWFSLTFPLVVEWLGKTFSLLRNIPFLGIINYSLNLLWHWVQTFSNKTSSWTDKLHSVLFITLAAGLNIFAYCLCIMAAGVVTFPAAVIFVLASAVDIFESMTDYFQNLDPVPAAASQTWEVAAQYERAHSLRLMQQQTFGIKLGAAILVTISIGIWCFFPPNLIISVSCMTFGWFVAWGKDSLLSSIHESRFTQLQKSIHRLPNWQDPDLMPNGPESMVQMTRLLGENAILRRRNAELIAENHRLQHPENGRRRTVPVATSHLRRRRPMPIETEGGQYQASNATNPFAL